MPSNSTDTTATVEATVTSKGQVTLPRELRLRLGLQKGSKIRFHLSDRSPVTVEPVLLELDDLWRLADQDNTSQPVLSFEEMNAAKSRRQW